MGLAAVALSAQEREDRTLLTQDQMTAIINEASGERAMHHILELVRYQRVRLPVEYEGNFRESEVMARFAREYGYSNVKIEKYGETNAQGQPNTAWQPTQGELWMTTPKSRKLFDIHDIALTLATLNSNGDIYGRAGGRRPGTRAGLRGQGRDRQVRAGSLRRRRRRRATPRPSRTARSARSARARSATSARMTIPNQIVSQQANATQPNTRRPGTSRRRSRATCRRCCSAGRRSRCGRSSRARRCRCHSEYVHAEIPGDGSTTQEVAISGHLYEGVIKQGANDDNSGCALTLEIGRTMIKLIKEGKLPRPKRTINFQWVPEIRARIST